MEGDIQNDLLLLNYFTVEKAQFLLEDGQVTSCIYIYLVTVAHFHSTAFSFTNNLGYMQFVGPVKPLLRASLRSNSSNGHQIFIPQCRKMIFEYCETWPTSANIRTFILKHLEDVARKNPHVEIVIKPRPHKEPIVRGLYCMYSIIIAL